MLGPRLFCVGAQQFAQSCRRLVQVLAVLVVSQLNRRHCYEAWAKQRSARLKVGQHAENQGEEALAAASDSKRNCQALHACCNAGSSCRQVYTCAS